jgi:hypothetical protein
MAKKIGDPISLNNWNIGGISESRILGMRDEAMYKMVGTNVHDEVGLLKNNRRLVKDSGTTIDGFVKQIVSCSDGNAYLFSSTSGKIWKRNSSGTYSLVYTTDSAVGNDYILGAGEYNGYLYWATQNYLYRIQVSHTGDTWSSYVEEVGHLNTDPVCGDSGYLGGSDNTSALGTSLSETEGGYTEFSPILKTNSGVAINIGTVPSTSITLTLHDSSNTAIATKTVTADNLSTGINEIYWNSVVTYELGATYHLHIFQTGTGGTVLSAVENDLTNVYLEVYGESNDEYHPMVVLNDVLFIGDNNYVHQYENTLTLNALDIPAEHVIRCLGKMDIDLLLGTEPASTIAKAMIFRWNTWSESWTIEDDIPENGIHAFIPVDNFVYVIAGDRGNVYFYNGQQLQLYRRIGGEFDRTDKIEVHANATASLHGIPLIGVSNSSGNPIECGVYGMGTVNPQVFPRIFDLEYVLSEGLSNNEIGAIAVYGDDILVSWYDGTSTYGVDTFDGDNLYSGTYIQTRVLYQDRNSRSVYRGARINYKEVLDNTPQTVTFTNATNIVNLEDHGLQDSEPIVFSTTDTLPAELTAGTTYYVRDVTDDTFKVSATAGGTAIAITDDGTGTHKVALANIVRFYYRKDYDTSWTELTLIHDEDKHQFVVDSFGDATFCIEFKLELRAWGSNGVVIDQITLLPQGNV